MEDVHRAGGIFAILGELDRAGLLHRGVPTVHARTLGEAIDRWDVMRTQDPQVFEFYQAAPGGIPTQTAFSQNRRYPELDLDRAAAAFATRPTPIRRTAAWPCSTAISRVTAAS
jgi:dihydroxy-acid dehydratase